MLFIRRHLVPFRLGITHWNSVLALFDPRHTRQSGIPCCSRDGKSIGNGDDRGWGQTLVMWDSLPLVSLRPTQITEHEILSLWIHLFTQGHPHILCLLLPIFPIICGPESSPRRVRKWSNKVPGWGDRIYVGHSAVRSLACSSELAGGRMSQPWLH